MMEDAGKLRFTHTWERWRKTGRDVMGLKEWEQESQGEKGSVGLGNQSLPAAAAQHPTMMRGYNATQWSRTLQSA